MNTYSSVDMLKRRWWEKVECCENSLPFRVPVSRHRRLRHVADILPIEDLYYVNFLESHRTLPAERIWGMKMNLDIQSQRLK